MDPLLLECEAINRLADFCGPRDVPELTQPAMMRVLGVPQADVMALFGGSILAGGDVLAEAIRAGIAAKYVIVGGAGHTTPALRARVARLYPEIPTEGEPEARIFAAFLRRRHGLEADLLETQSTNCGNNITFLLDLLRAEGIPARSIVLCQDATMQRRMDAGLRKHAPGVRAINYAAYRVRAQVQDGQLTFDHTPPGMWPMDRYVSLLMGEIPRLTDDAGGYGPTGKNFIAHVDVPEPVREAFAQLQSLRPTSVRAADDRYASPH